MITDLEKEHSVLVSIDCTVFAYDEEQLKVLLIKRKDDPFKGQWALPGYLITPHVDITLSAKKKLETILGVKQPYVEQVYTFGTPERHPYGHVLTISYFSLYRFSDMQDVHLEEEYKWVSVHSIGDLAFDHNTIIEVCFTRLKQVIRTSPVAFELLPKQLKVLDMVELYNAIFNIDLDKRNFRRKLFQLDILVETGCMEQQVSHRPAKYYQFNEHKYQALLDRGGVFEMHF